jgi:hypothetical protein
LPITVARRLAGRENDLWSLFASGLFITREEAMRKDAETEFLIERLGAEEYSRLLAEPHRGSTVATVNGYSIRQVQTRFGRLYVVEGTERAFSTLAQAKDFAATPGD